MNRLLEEAKEQMRQALISIKNIVNSKGSINEMILTTELKKSLIVNILKELKLDITEYDKPDDCIQELKETNLTHLIDC